MVTVAQIRAAHVARAAWGSFTGSYRVLPQRGILATGTEDPELCPESHLPTYFPREPRNEALLAGLESWRRWKNADSRKSKGETLKMPPRETRYLLVAVCVSGVVLLRF